MSIQATGIMNYQTIRNGVKQMGKYIQKKRHDIQITLASHKKGTVTSINFGCDIKRSDGTGDVCQFQTLPSGTKIITNTFGQKRLTTLTGKEVVVNEGGEIRVVSPKTFIDTYEPVPTNISWRDGIEYCGFNATAKSGTRSYLDILSSVVHREYKELCKTFEQKGIKLTSYKPAQDLYSYDTQIGRLTLEVNGQEIEMYNLLETNELGLMRILKALFVEGKKPNDFNNGSIHGKEMEKFVNKLYNEISSKLNKS